MAGYPEPSPDWLQWRERFGIMLSTGPDSDRDAAADAACDAQAAGATDLAAEVAGLTEARRCRAARRNGSEVGPKRGGIRLDQSTRSFGVEGSFEPSRSHEGDAEGTRIDEVAPQGGLEVPSTWSTQLAGRIFDRPYRWGWETAAFEQPVRAGPEPEPPEDWADLPSIDLSKERKARSMAAWKVFRRLIFLGGLGMSAVIYQAVIKKSLRSLDSQEHRIVLLVSGVGGLFLLVALISSLLGLRRAHADLAARERPYLALRSSEKARRQLALSQWERDVREHREQAQRLLEEDRRRSTGPLWFPVNPLGDPVRVDVLGGDPRGHGWASLLTTLGSAAVARGARLVVLDFTGQDVAGGLVAVTKASGRSAAHREIHDHGDDVDLLMGLDPTDLAESIARAFVETTESQDGHHDRILVAQVLRSVVGCLDKPWTFKRLAAGVQVLRQGRAGDVLSTREVSSLIDAMGDLDQSEWTQRQLRVLSAQLNMVASRVGGAGESLWRTEVLQTIATPGTRDDGTKLVNRLLVELTQLSFARRAPSLVVVAAADHLGAKRLQNLADAARTSNVQLILMIERPHGDLETVLGTGGAVCIMKMGNHRDANTASEFVGRGYRFVLSQMTQQVGTTLSDGGGDSYTLNLGTGSSRKQGRRPSRKQLSDSRGEAWGNVRNWSSAQNVGSSTATSRVYEFVVEPTQIMGMPETAFLLVDNSGRERRVVMADANPGLCLHPRTSATALSP